MPWMCSSTLPWYNSTYNFRKAKPHLDLIASKKKQAQLIIAVHEFLLFASTLLSLFMYVLY